MRAALFCSALASVFLVDACGSSCPDKATLCKGVCATLATDPQNCGACGNACATGFACTAGTCAPACPTGSTACGDVCVNPDTDQDNCGACGTKCLSGQACTAGLCGTSCLAGFSACSADGGGQICANELTDSANCGACNAACPAGSVCNGNGACAGNCATGFSVCAADGGAAYCANFITDNQNCGACSAPCPSGEACSDSHCATTCAPGYSSCNGVGKAVGTCANVLIDSNNCGACGKVCDPGQTCTAGTCAETCAAGFSACGGGDGGPPYCANVETDSANCGACRKPCLAGQLCNGMGTCAESCAFPYGACADAGAGPYCANVSDDTNNCGVCGKTCAPGATCKASSCSESCAFGYNVCSAADGGASYCADLLTDSDNCNACGNICPSGKSCSAGKCTESCAFGFSACTNSYCADLTTDVNNCGTCGTSCGSSFKAPGCCDGVCTSLSSGDLNHCGTCGIACTAGYAPGCCAAGCVDLATNADNCGGCDIVCPSGICLGSNCCSAACGTDLSTDCLGSCDATGACTHPTCSGGYGCGLSPTCKTTCGSDSDCAPDSGYSCWNPPGGSCCLPVATGATLYVDGKLGVDTSCCDSSTTPCQTITFAMKQIAAAAATGVTIDVSWNADPTTRADWAPANGETYPIHLGYGVTLQAPGIFFTPAATAAGDAFDVYAYATGDTGAVTIEGSSTDYMFIGFDSKQKNLTGTTVAVNSGVGSQTSVPLTLNKVWLNGQTYALNLGEAANVSLGPSPVIIGSGAATANPLPLVMSPGSGIYCKGAKGKVATLTDLDAGGSSVLDVDQQDTGLPPGTYTFSDIYAYDYCTIILTQSPIIGVPPPCPTPKVDGEGILDLGGSSMTLTGATVQCMYNHGIDVGETPAGVVFSGTPTLTLDSTLVQNTGQTGLKVSDGTVGPVTSSTIYHCRFGAVLGYLGALDLSGGGNIVACSTSKEPGGYTGVAAGINVWNDSASTSLNASNLLWDNSPPDYWTCTDPANTTGANGSTAANCTCASGVCNGVNVAVPDDSDAVTAANTNAVPINMSDAGLQTTYTCGN